MNDGSQQQPMWSVTGASYEQAYQQILLQPTAAPTPKVGGAKQGGERTGVYTFGTGTNTIKMLIKQGDSVGETVAEFIGGQLYQLTIPDYAAKSILVRDNLAATRQKGADVYVTSEYEDAIEVTDAFKVAGLSERPPFARLRHAVQKKLKSGSNEEGLIRKVIADDEKTTERSIGLITANVLWHGDHDIHMGNLVRVTKEKDGKTISKYSKIDHGFSFFNFKKKVVNIFNPLAGRKASVSLKRSREGGKLFEAYPFNNFWDLAAEKKRLYYSGAFIQGLENLLDVTPETISDNIRHSLEDVCVAYADNAGYALYQFAARMKMNSLALNQVKKMHRANDVDGMVQFIGEYMSERLVARQQSLISVCEHCRQHAAKLTDEHHQFARDIDSLIVKKTDAILEMEARGYYNPDVIKQKLFEIDLLKLLEQAIDQAWITVGPEGLELKGNFTFYNHQKLPARLHVSPDEFKQSLEAVKQSANVSQDVTLIINTLERKGPGSLWEMINERINEMPSNPNFANEIKLLQMLRKAAAENALMVDTKGDFRFSKLVNHGGVPITSKAIAQLISQLKTQGLSEGTGAFLKDLQSRIPKYSPPSKPPPAVPQYRKGPIASESKPPPRPLPKPPKHRSGR